jgi:hypothetical protein
VLFVVAFPTENFHVVQTLLAKTLVRAVMDIQFGRRLFVSVLGTTLTDIPA